VPWYRRHVGRAVGGHPARERGVCRGPLVPPVPRGRNGPVPVHARVADAPGPRGRKDPVHRDLRAGPDRAEQHPFRYHPGQHRVHRRQRRRPAGRRGPAARRPPPVQGQHGHRRAGAPAVGAGPRRAAGDADGHQQLGRRPARQYGQCPGRPRGQRPVRQAAVSRLLPDRGERLVHQDARTRLPGRSSLPHHPADGGPGRRHDNVGQEGPAGQHRRLARAQRRRSRRALPQPADPHRGLPHLRRAGRA
jgi:hypothetical protein